MKRLFPCMFILAVTSWTQAGEPPLHPWQVHEITITASSTMENPYVEGLPDHGENYVTAIFTTEEQLKRREYRIAGFWDGGQTWRVRFAPPTPGKWQYRTISKDPGLAGKTGTLTCTAWDEAAKTANPTRRGFVQVCRTGERPGRYFQYADGTPFFWLGDTWWNWTKERIQFESFKKLADDRAEKGFTVGQLFFAGRGWGEESSMLDRSCTQPDLEHIRRVERMIRYANERGITVWVHGWWSRKDMDESIGAENMRRWCRYMVHRLGAWNVVWVLAGEYNMNDYGGMGLGFWKDLGRLFEEEDAYDRIISAHPTPPGWGGGAEAPQWSTAEVMHDQAWLDYNQSQVGHGRWRNEMIPLVVQDAYGRTPAKPIVVTEPWYEFIKGNPTAADIRFGGWSAVLSGAAGHSYAGGHVWKAHVPESPAGADTWPMEMDLEANTLDYPGAVSLGFMAETLRGLDWWTLEPHPELISDNPSRFCGADPGRLYVVYLRWGGWFRLDLTAASGEDAFEYTWIDQTENAVASKGTTTGGAIREFYPPASYPGLDHPKDWVVIFRKK